MQSFGKAYTVIDCTVTVDTHEAGRSVPDAATSEASSLPVRPLLTGRITACLRVCRSSVHPPTGITIPITQISDRNRIQNGCNAFIRCSSSSAVFPFWWYLQIRYESTYITSTTLLRAAVPLNHPFTIRNKNQSMKVVWKSGDGWGGKMVQWFWSVTCERGRLSLSNSLIIQTRFLGFFRILNRCVGFLIHVAAQRSTADDNGGVVQNGVPCVCRYKHVHT